MDDQELSPGRYAARLEEHSGRRAHLATRLERLSSWSALLGQELRDGNPLRADDIRRLERKVESVWEAIALERATRP
jgi:hypothetical protein